MPRSLILGTSLMAIAVIGSAASSAPLNALPATVNDYSPQITPATYPATSPDGAALEPVDWRVVHGTGNCCENYIAATSTGRILDFGGSKLRFSDDGGESWSEVVALAPVNGEGATVEAPNGDIVGVTWDPYSGDRVEAFKFDAAEGKWYYAENKLHTPFFDRPYITVVPGPFTVNGSTVPYVTVMLGGWPQKTTYMSTDGMNYIPSGSHSVLAGFLQSKYLDLPNDPKTDWLQPLTVPGMAPLPGGGALGWTPSNGSLELSIMEPPSTTWSPFQFPNQPSLQGRLLFDSHGRIHNTIVGADGITYGISSDGGRSWKSTTMSLPLGYQAVMPEFDRFWDFKVNAGLDMAAVSLYARNTQKGKDQNLVLILSTSEGDPWGTKVLFAGTGDKVFGTGLGAADRLDFVTLAILPDGRVMTTFLDTNYSSPALAVTLQSQQPTGVRSVESSPTPHPTASESSTPESTSSPEPTQSAPPDDDTVPRLTDVGDGPDPFSPDGDGKKDKIRIRFTLSEDAAVRLSIFMNGRRVKTLLRGKVLPGGAHKISWGGRNKTGRRVRNGTYTYRIRAVDANGNAGETSRGRLTVRA